MRVSQNHLHKHAKRSGLALVMMALLLPIMIGMVALVIDGGLLLAAHRHAQGEADAAALAAAVDLVQGKSADTARATAQTYVTTYQAQSGEYDNLANARVVTYIPPSSGPYSGNNHYAEVLVTNPVRTFFIQVLNLIPGIDVNSTPSVQTRAVAGFELLAGQDAIITLAPNVFPGLLVDRAQATVHGSVAVNSQGGGFDQNGKVVNRGQPNFGAMAGTSTLESTGIRVVGGVDAPGNFRNLAGSIGSPPALQAGVLPTPDPLEFLPTPTAANVPNLTPRGAIRLINGNTVLQPGVYDSIQIVGSASVTFQPGIYVLAAKGANALAMVTSGTVTGNGMMFYNTGSNYLAGGAGSNDARDGTANPTLQGTMPARADSPTFGNVLINTGDNISLSALNDPSSPFNGMLFYQRRLNTQPILLGGFDRGSTLSAGTIYAKWAPVQIAGQMNYNLQLIVGSLALRRSDLGLNINIGPSQRQAVAGNVFLVE